MNLAQIPSDVPICIDGRMLIDTGTGVATYARSLRAAVSLIGDAPWILSARRARSLLPPWLAAAGQGQQHVHASLTENGDQLLQGTDLFRRAHLHFRYRHRLYRIHCDALPFGIMHWTYPVPMHVEGWINLYTVHDMIPIDSPDLTPINRRRHYAVLGAITAEAEKIITVSESARQSILTGLGCEPALVVNGGQAVDHASGQASNTAETLPAGLQTDNYLLIVGSIEPRKNIAAMLAAYRATTLSMPLVIAGPDGWQSAAIIEAINATPGAIRLPYLSRAALMHLIAGARALLYASLAEGFGLPMIEAMALGTPVLTSQSGALAEIAGGAALLTDPTDPNALREAIVRITGDEGLRRQLRALGLARTANFSVENFAERLGSIYQQVLQAWDSGHSGQAMIPAGRS